MGSNAASDFIKVAVRIRPKIKREIKRGQNDHWGYNGSEVFQLDENGRANQECFTFDYVFGTESKNTDMYKVVRPIVQQATQGINGTVFAYGQTSSGKTHSIMGNEEDMGIIPQAINDIFSHIENNNANRKFLIRASYIEIYNERINDLLNASAKDLKIREDVMGNVSVKGTEEITRTREELLNVVHEGNKKRQIGETNMNDRSSRSHVIFQIIIESSEQREGDNQDVPVQVSNLYLVDLAGSERVAQTKATGARLKEGGHINKSLSVLSLVMQQLSSKQEHISFRDSKLTRILSNALGGNSKTLIIATITPVSIENTLSTLMFAKCAKTIMNQPRVNEILNEAALIKQHQQKEKLLLKELQDEKEKNITLQMDKHQQDKRIKSLESKLKIIRHDFVNIKAGPVSKIPKRRHTSAFEKPKEEPVHPETRLTSIFESKDEEAYLDRAKTPELVDISLEIPSTPASVLKSRLDHLNTSHIQLKNYHSDELKITQEREQELSSEIERIKGQLKTAEEERIKSEKLLREFEEKYEQKDITCAEVEFKLGLMTKKYTTREQELIGKLTEQTNLNQKYKELETEMYAMKREREYMSEIKRCASALKIQLETLEQESTDLKMQRDQLVKDYSTLQDEHAITVSKKQLFLKQVELLTRGVCGGARDGIQRTSSDSAIYGKAGQVHSKANLLLERKNENSIDNEITEMKQDLCSLKTIISSRSVEEVSSSSNSFSLQGNGDSITIREDLKAMKEKCKKVRNFPEAIEDVDYFRIINERYISECQRLEGVIKEMAKVKDQEMLNVNESHIKKSDHEEIITGIHELHNLQLKCEAEKYQEMLKHSDQKLKEIVDLKDSEIQRLKQDHFSEMNFLKKTVNENGLALEEANTKITLMASTLQSKEEELVHLVRRLRQSDETKDKAEKEMLRKFKVKFEEARNEIDEMSSDLMDKISLIEKLEESLKKSQEDAERLKIKMKSFETSKKELEHTKEHLAQEVKQKEEEISHLQEKLERNLQPLQEDLKQCRVEVENSKNLQEKVLLDYQNKLEKLQAQNELNQALQKTQDELERAQTDLKQSQVELANCKNLQKTQEAVLRESQSSLTKLQGDLKQAHEDLARSEGEVEEKRECLNQLQIEIERLKLDLHAREIGEEREIEKLEIQPQMKPGEGVKMLEQQADQKRKLEEDIEALRKVFDGMETRKEEMQRNLVELKEKLEQQNDSGNVLQKALELKDKLLEEQKEAFKRAMDDLVKEKDQIFENQREAFMKLQDNLREEKDQTIKEMEEKIKKDQSLLLELYKDIEQLQRELEETEKRLEQCKKTGIILPVCKNEVDEGRCKETVDLLPISKNIGDEGRCKETVDLLPISKNKGDEDKCLKELEIPDEEKTHELREEDKNMVLRELQKNGDPGEKEMLSKEQTEHDLVERTRVSEKVILMEASITLPEKLSLLEKKQLLRELELSQRKNEDLAKKEMSLKEQLRTLQDRQDVLEKTRAENVLLLRALEQKLLANQKVLEQTKADNETMLMEQANALRAKEELLERIQEDKDKVLQEQAKALREKEELLERIQEDKDKVLQEKEELLERIQEGKDKVLQEKEALLERIKEDKDKVLQEQAKALQEKEALLERIQEDKDKVLQEQAKSLQKKEELLERIQEDKDKVLQEQAKALQEKEELLERIQEDKDKVLQEKEALLERIQDEKVKILQELKQKLQENEYLVEKETLFKRQVETLQEKQAEKDLMLKAQDLKLLETEKARNEKEIMLSEQAKTLQDLLSRIQDKDRILLEMEQKLRDNGAKLHERRIVLEKTLEEKGALERKLLECRELLESAQKSKETVLRDHAETRDLLVKTEEERDKVSQALQQKLQENEKTLQELEKTQGEKDTVLRAMRQKLLDNRDLVRTEYETLLREQAEALEKTQNSLEKVQGEKGEIIKALEQKLLDNQDLVRKECEILLREQAEALQKRQDSLEKIQGEKEKIIKALEQKLQDHQKLVRELEHLPNILKQREQNILGFQERVDKLAQCLQRNEKLLDEKASEFENLKVKVQAEEAQNLLYLQEINRNSEEKSTLLEDLQNARNDRERVTKQQKQILSEKEKLAVRVQELADVNEKLLIRLKELEPQLAMNNQLIERIQLLEQHLQKCKGVEVEQRKTWEANLELQRQLFLRSQEINQLNTKIVQLSDKQVSPESTELAQTNRNLRRQLQSANERLSELNQRNEECRTLIEDRARVGQLEASKAEAALNEQLEELKKLMKNRESEFEVLRVKESEKVAALEKHLLHVKDDCNELKAELEAARVSSERRNGEIFEKAEIISGYETYLMNVIAGKLETYKPSPDEKTDSEQRTKLQQIKTKLTEMLQKKLTDPTEQACPDQTIEGLKKDLAAKQEELDGLKQDNETLDLEVVGFQEIVQKQNEEIRDLEEQIRVRRGELEAAKQDNETLDMEVVGFQEIVEKQKKEAEELEKKVQELTADNEHLDMEVLGALDVIKGLEVAQADLTQCVKQKDDLIKELQKNQDLSKGCTNCTSLKLKLNSMQKANLQSEVKTLLHASSASKQEECSECKKLRQSCKELAAKCAKLEEDVVKVQKSKEREQSQECRGIIHTETLQSIQRVHDLLNLLRQTKELSGCDCCNSFMRTLVQFHNEINGLRSMPEDLQSINNKFTSDEQRLINLLQNVTKISGIQGLEDIAQKLNEELTIRQVDLKRYKRTTNLRKVFLTEVLFIMNKSESTFQTFYKRLKPDAKDNVSACPSCPKSRKFCELILKIKERVTSTIPMMEQMDLPLSSLEFYQFLLATQDKCILPLQEELSSFQSVQVEKNNDQVRKDLETLKAKYNSLTAVAIMRMEKLKTLVQYFEKEGFKVLNIDQKPGDIKISRNPLQNPSPDENKPNPFDGSFSLDKARSIGSNPFPFPSKFIKSVISGATNVKPPTLSDQVRSRRAVYQIADTNSLNESPSTSTDLQRKPVP